MGDPYPSDEAARWGQEVDARTRKYVGDVRSVLTDAASRGFLAAPGVALEALVAIGETHKHELDDANAKLYQEHTTRRVKSEEVDAKVALGLAKIDLKLLEAQLDNNVDLTKAYSDMYLDQQKAALERLDSDVKKRTAYIIEEKAIVEHEVNYWRGVAIDAEGIALDAEIQLIKEKVKTAETRLEIIDYLYQLIAAEELVTVAQIQRARALERVIEKEEELAEIKKTMIPLHQEKARARLAQADAIEEEAYAKEEIELLGYERVRLRREQEEVEHQSRLKEEELEEARLQYHRQNYLSEITRIDARIILGQYEEKIREKVMSIKKALEKEEKRFGLDQRHFWEKYGWNQDFSMTELNRLITVLETLHKYGIMIELARDKKDTIMKQGDKTIVRSSAAHMHQYISKG